MRIPLSYLQTFFAEELPPTDRLVGLLDGLGLSVETVHHLPAAPQGVVVARIESAEPIPGSANLKVVVARPADGAPAVQVVCGAPNAGAGLTTALALPGISLPGLPETVGQRSVMGVSSNGVLASPRELGVYDHAAGLIAFPADLPLGASLAELWPAETVIELELTPNRGDAFSLLGVARDLGAKLGWRVLHPASGADLGDPGIEDGLSIEIDDLAACPRFTLRAIEGVSIAPSPPWLQRRLASLGLRPRNNVVDVTNLVTFGLGQPCHAYDRRALTGGVIQVRRARVGESLELLNEEKVELDPDDLVIATPQAPDGARTGASYAIGMAGVMGGRHDSVVDDTTEVALEVALFDQVAVRRSARRHKLVTDARTRFERGVDPNLQPAASAYAAALIAEVAGGRVHPGVSEVGGDVERPAVAYRPARLHFLMDFEVADSEQRGYLERLGFRVEEHRANNAEMRGHADAAQAGRPADAAQAGRPADAAQAGRPTDATQTRRANDAAQAPRSTDTTWQVTPPSWRYDITIEEDVIEEVARLHGYEHVGMSVPSMFFVPPASDPTHRALRTRLAAMGLQETISYVFTGEAELARAGAPAPHVRLAAPQGQDRAVLRTALLPGLLAAAELNRRPEALAMFEVGRVFIAAEEERLALILRGKRLANGWRDSVKTDFFVLKGLLEQLAALAGADIELRPVADAASHPSLHPGAAATVHWDGEAIGVAGRVHPEVEARYEQPELFVAELRLPLSQGRVRFQEFSRQPYSERDLAVIAPAEVSYAALREVCAAAAGSWLESIEPFDVYQGKQLAEGKRSVALRLRFRDERRSLTDAEVDAVMVNVMQALRNAGYDIRA